jgi:putative transposase
MWLTTAHVRRYHRHYHNSGHVWQGRFRSFPIQEDDHLLAMHRFIERNPVRARLMRRAEDWRWSSAAPAREGQPELTPSPVRHLGDWLRYINEPQTEAEVEALRESIRGRRPYGSELWTRRTARKMDLEASLRPVGRPAKKAAKPAGLFESDEGRE